MSKITNDGLTRSGTGCFIAVYPYDNSGRQGVNGIKSGSLKHRLDYSHDPTLNTELPTDE